MKQSNNHLPDSDISLIKAQMRAQLITIRRSMPSDVKVQADRRIIDTLFQVIREQQPKVLGGYLAIAGEPELMPLYTSLSKHGILFALPFAAVRRTPLSYRLWNPGEVLGRDASGMRAPPAENTEIKPDIVLAPCIGFNNEGYRLGFGGGYFDRTLAQPSAPMAIGIAYANAQINFPLEAHDIALQQIITEKLLYKNGSH